MSIPVFPANWFWFVAGDETRAFSSAKGDYVAADSPELAASRVWTEPNRIPTEAELGEILARYGLPTGQLPAPRREIPKLTVQSRLQALGRMAAAWAALQSDPNALGRWFLDGLHVYADDPDLLQMLQAIGCTADEIAQVTA